MEKHDIISWISAHRDVRDISIVLESEESGHVTAYLSTGEKTEYAVSRFLKRADPGKTSIPDEYSQKVQRVCEVLGIPVDSPTRNAQLLEYVGLQSELCLTDMSIYRVVRDFADIVDTMRGVDKESAVAGSKDKAEHLAYLAQLLRR